MVDTGQLRVGARVTFEGIVDHDYSEDGLLTGYVGVSAHGSFAWVPVGWVKSVQPPELRVGDRLAFMGGVFEIEDVRPYFLFSDGSIGGFGGCLHDSASPGSRKVMGTLTLSLAEALKLKRV